MTDFTQIDPHFGTNQELNDFIAAAHERGMKVYFDIIANHTADVIYYAGLENQNPPYVYKKDNPYKDKNGQPFDPAQYARADNFPEMNAANSSFPRRSGNPSGHGTREVPRLAQRSDSLPQLRIRRKVAVG
ncbi:hypothetical protein INS90_04250 [Trueperella pecoris]|uniref:Glycosyl hydrolase family 13 catalytic domain-containing protein n=1 Tax=Trueperella pecoris TaxID=2733571 RepID=A0A7M1R5H5_9ACTO|nr:hypothetical protein INS90_04250 [Trueperella pecoris]